MRRVVVTGCGVVSPIGSGKKNFFNSLEQGKSGIDEITLFDAAAFPVRIAGEVKDLDSDGILGIYPEACGISDRKVFLGLSAFSEAIADSQIGEETLKNGRTGINSGVCLEVLPLEEFHKSSGNLKERLKDIYSDLLKRGTNLQTPLDTTNKFIIEKYKISGPGYVNCSACAASAQAIGHSCQVIKRGNAEVFICGGFDSMINPLGIGGFSLLGALSTKNELKGAACRPFDVRRDGAVIGEGAGALVIEELDHALKRSAKIYCEILGFGSSLDAYKPTDPDPEGDGAAAAIGMALRSARLSPDKIDYINAHGTSTPKNDEIETKAVKKVFGSKAYQIPVSSTKSMIGHLIAASGGVEFIACLLGFERNLIPPTINYDKKDPYCDLDYVANRSREWQGEYILSNSFGFGGQNACLILKRWSKE
ncbi:MAG: beta-ketoacyl-[acyl-carrier-protein] synthase family protein [Candidatus Aminicenantes bacterium]|nr:beta-ketoacyl-[acyl-carrier-protein] synthase family protein [Candidatus Aminicenantes bacterium]